MQLYHEQGSIFLFFHTPEGEGKNSDQGRKFKKKERKIKKEEKKGRERKKGKKKRKIREGRKNILKEEETSLILGKKILKIFLSLHF